MGEVSRVRARKSTPRGWKTRRMGFERDVGFNKKEIDARKPTGEPELGFSDAELVRQMKFSTHQLDSLLPTSTLKTHRARHRRFCASPPHPDFESS